MKDDTPRDWTVLVPVRDVGPLLVAEPQATSVRRSDDSGSPYVRTFANHALSGFSAVIPNASPEFVAVAELQFGPWTSPDRVIALNGDSLLVGTPDMKLWQVSIRGGLTFEFPYVIPTTSFADYGVAVVPGGTNYAVALPGVAPIPIAAPATVADRYRRPADFLAEVYEQVVFVPHEHAFTEAQTDFDPRLNREHTWLTHYQLGTQPEPELVWSAAFNVMAYRSPVLSDRTLVMHLPNALVLIDRNGKTVREMPYALQRNRLSVDGFDRIWGLHEFDGHLHLMGILSTSAPFFYARLPAGVRPTQPPICFPDRRVCLVASSAVLCYDAKGLQWNTALPAVDGVLATGTADGHLFVKAGAEVLRIDANGHEVWRARTPDDEPITTNIALTSSGAVCLATPSRVYCMASER